VLTQLRLYSLQKWQVKISHDNSAVCAYFDRNARYGIWSTPSPFDFSVISVIMGPEDSDSLVIGFIIFLDDSPFAFAQAHQFLLYYTYCLGPHLRLSGIPSRMYSTVPTDGKLHIPHHEGSHGVAGINNRTWTRRIGGTRASSRSHRLLSQRTWPRLSTTSVLGNPLEMKVLLQISALRTLTLSAPPHAAADIIRRR
jgi:hypothetical protein